MMFYLMNTTSSSSDWLFGEFTLWATPTLYYESLVWFMIITPTRDFFTEVRMLQCHHFSTFPLRFHLS